MSTKVQYTLAGFAQDVGFRVFTFERLGEDRTRTKCIVRADLALVRRYGIRVQELPLLCRALLERRHTGEDMLSFTYTEEEMCLYAKECSAERAAAAAKRKPPRKPLNPNLGSGWRVPQPM
jgi:hypothetical protein